MLRIDLSKRTVYKLGISFLRFPKRFYSADGHPVYSGQSKFGYLWMRYNYHLIKHPMQTKMLSAGFIAFAADIVCQVSFPADEMTDNKEGQRTKESSPFWKISWRRTFSMAAINMCLVSPMQHFWYGFLSTRIIGKSFFSAVQRVAIDQTFFTPCY
jgi:hypothetical protein